MLAITKQNGLLYIDLEYIQKNLDVSRPCEVCDKPLTDHKWVELDDNGLCDRCSLVNIGPSPDEIKPTEMVSYNAYGGVEMRCDRAQLEEMLNEFETNGTLALGCWELRRDPWSATWIDARVAPTKRFDGRDNRWASWDFTFQPVE